MKSIIVAVTGLAALAAPAAAESPDAPESDPASLAEPAAPPAWTVQVDPLTTALGFVHVQIERRVAPSWSIYAGPHARLFSGITTDGDSDNRGVGVEAGVRWFFLARHRAPAGLWAQLRGVIARVEHEGSADPGGYVSGLIGYTLIASGRWVLAGGLGVQYIHYEAGGVGIEGVLPAAHTAVGVAF